MTPNRLHPLAADHYEIGSTPQVIVTVLGAREHYEPVVMLAKSGWLARLITDFWNPSALIRAGASHLRFTLRVRVGITFIGPPGQQAGSMRLAIFAALRLALLGSGFIWRASLAL
jgi:hypothetical protein